MKPIHARKSQKRPLFKALMALLFVIMLTACGTSSTAGSALTQAPTVGTTKTATNVPASDPLHLNAANLNVQQGNLLIQSSGGFQCPGSRVRSSSSLIGQLVLASDRLTYSQDEIAQMRAYADNEQFLGAGGVALPPTLSWISGGSMDSIPGEIPHPGEAKSGCIAKLQLINTGNTPIQVSKVGVQLEARPQQNTHQYHLINLCSILPPDESTAIGLCPPTGGGGPGECSVYDASIQLASGEKNDVFSAVPGATGCSTLTIAPAAQVTLNITFSLAASTPQNLLFSIKPTFTIETDQGEQTLLLSQLESTLAFASASQFSCYGLQGTTFALINPPFSAPTWCM
jgi:hypothetical protein